MLVAVICSIISSTIISIVWVRLIDQSNKMLEQDKKENHDKESI
jgi:C4-dicarboxylate transporter